MSKPSNLVRSTPRRCFLQTGFVVSAATIVASESVAETFSMSPTANLDQTLVHVIADKVIGIGFIVRMGKQQYIVTSATVVSGHNKPLFKTLSGKTVQPRKIELSATRNLARFLVADQSALELDTLIAADERITVLDYMKTEEVEEQGGTITGESKHMIEVSAPFEQQSSGSPLLNHARHVCGVANYLTYYKMVGSSWTGTPRAYASKLDDASWYSPNWKAYNRTYGKSLQDIDTFRDHLYEIVASWMQNPKDKIEMEADLGIDFDRWVKAHNGMITDISELKNQRRDDNPNTKIAKTFKKNCDDLIQICQAKAKQLEFIYSNKKITPYLKNQFKWRALEIKKFCKIIETHKRDQYRTRWI